MDCVCIITSSEPSLPVSRSPCISITQPSLPPELVSVPPEPELPPGSECLLLSLTVTTSPRELRLPSVLECLLSGMTPLPIPLPFIIMSSFSSSIFKQRKTYIFNKISM